jgi:hypothetical protein
MRSLVGPMTGEVESAADRHRRRHQWRGATGALLWKIEGVPALRASLFRPNALTALIDTWVLCNQMTDASIMVPARRRWAGRVWYRRHLPPVGGTNQRHRRRGELFRRRVKGAGLRAEMGGRTSNSAFHRQSESTLSSAGARGLRSVVRHGSGRRNNDPLDDFNRRLEIYSDQLVRQVRWEAELFKADLLAELRWHKRCPWRNGR